MPNNKSKVDKTFSVTEVGTLVESLQTDIRSVSEGVISLHSDMDDVKTRLSSVEVELRSLKDVVRVAVPSINVRLSNLEAKAGV
ncbi:MAG: hypothetical protein A2351_04240 [Omnitrophica bacterium RIFOXYB12_FULL_50_7]|nr:MAG: hypothetical protein A2351_04240 [Omnitrophica bacterium RIFOXYB12_FULL_50_7]